MNTSIISLYAKAVTFKPVFATVDAPLMPDCKRVKQISISETHVQTYNAITKWCSTHSRGVHPNYIQTLSLPMQLDMMVQDSFPFKPLGLVHIGNQISVCKLPIINQKILLVTEFGNTYFHKKGWLFEVITKAYNFELCPDLTRAGENEPLIVGNSLYLARMQHDKEKLQHISEKSNNAPDWLKLGQSKLTQALETAENMETFSFESDIGRRYARVSGDYNPIHLHPLTAKMLGFKKAIAHGMFSKAIAISCLQKQSWLEDNTFQVKTVFMQPIALPANVDMYAKVITDEKRKDFMLTSNSKFKPRVHLFGEICELK